MAGPGDAPITSSTAPDSIFRYDELLNLRTAPGSIFSVSPPARARLKSTYGKLGLAPHVKVLLGTPLPNGKSNTMPFTPLPVPDRVPGSEPGVEVIIAAPTLLLAAIWLRLGGVVGASRNPSAPLPAKVRLASVTAVTPSSMPWPAQKLAPPPFQVRLSGPMLPWCPTPAKLSEPA